MTDHATTADGRYAAQMARAAAFMAEQPKEDRPAEEPNDGRNER